MKMAPREKKSQLKRGLVCFARIRVRDNLEHADSVQNGAEDRESSKKPRRSSRLSQSQAAPLAMNPQLPSPVTHQESATTEGDYKETTATPPEGRPSQIQHHEHNSSNGLSSPPQDTQAFSQFMHPSTTMSEEVKDETEEGVWGYLLPMDQKYGKSLVMRKRDACPMPDSKELSSTKKTKSSSKQEGGKDLEYEEDAYERTKFKGIASGGYLIGRHPECGKLEWASIDMWLLMLHRSHYRRPSYFQPALFDLYGEQRRRHYCSD